MERLAARIAPAIQTARELPASDIAASDDATPPSREPRKGSSPDVLPGRGRGAPAPAARRSNWIAPLAIAGVIAAGGIGFGVWWSQRPSSVVVSPDKPGAPPQDTPRQSSSARVEVGIVGGSPVSPDAWPSVVQVYDRSFSSTIATCNGSIIDRQWVMTAGICVSRANPQNLFIREGSHLSGGGRIVEVGAIVMHEGYAMQGVTINDIALLQLATPAQAAPQMMIGNRQRADLLKSGTVSTVVGFSAPGGDPAAGRLEQVELAVVPSAQCGQTYGKPITDINFCAGTTVDRRGACQGSAGGPVYVKDGGGEPVQAGMMSWGGGCGRVGLYEVYTSVGYFEDWIRQRVPGAMFSSATRKTP